MKILQKLGIARYEFLTKIVLNDANITCVKRFLQSPQKLKFPNLTGADLSHLILDKVNFIRGNLSQANLSHTSLIKAYLIFADFTNNNLKNANLQGATLNETIWVITSVENCQLQNNQGLTPAQRKDLQKRGAVL